MIRLTTGVASCVLLLPIAGCRRPSADLNLPGDAGGPGREPELSEPAATDKTCATPKPAPGSPDDHEAPIVLGARFVAADRVQLSFSEALAPVDAVNPRQFRLSRAYTMIDDDGGGYVYATGYYYDLAGPDSYSQPLVVIKLELYEQQPEILALTLSRPIPPEVCEQLGETQAQLEQMANQPEGRRGETGLFLHYTARGSDGVRDRVNNPLDEFGADWAINFGVRQETVYGTEPVTRLDLLPRLECPGPGLRSVGSAPPGPI